MRETDTSLQSNTLPPEDLKSELDFAQYQLQTAMRMNQHLQDELLEIKRSHAWTAVTLYRKVIGFSRQILTRFLRVFKLQIRTPRLVKGNTSSARITGSKKATGQNVAILTPTFFDFDGNNMFFGGAERYVIELVRLVREFGYDAEVYQCGNSDWERFYHDFRVRGLDVNRNFSALSSRYHELQKPSPLVIYSPFSLASNKIDTPSIGISHGIFWDIPIHYPAWIHAAKSAHKIIGSIENCTRMVSVDTNTINWVRTSSLTKANNCLYIPNFVDLDQFQPVTRKKNDGRLTVLYPRRLYTPRGFWLVSEILPDLLHDFPQLDFHFVGKAGSKEEDQVQEFVNAFQGRVKWYFLPPEKMQTAYQNADITLIPTVHSEGTSLSCLEALASGNAVIATSVGGLPDLIFNGYNGLLIEPNAASLRRAISLLCEDENLRRRIQMHGRAVAEAFSIQRWRAEWKRLLIDLLPAENGSQIPIQKSKFAIVIPPDGMEWGSGPLSPAQKTALDLAGCGYETYWVTQGNRLSDPVAKLHIVSQDDDLYLTDPLIFIFSSSSDKRVARFGCGRVIYNGEHDSLESLESLIKSLIA